MDNSFNTRWGMPEIHRNVTTEQKKIVAIDLGKPVAQWYRTSMPAYEIYFRCEDCQREHTIHMKIHLTEGPDRKQSLAEFFAGRSMPPQVSSLQGHNAFCLKTGRRFKLDKDEQILLVPPSAISVPARQIVSS